MNELLLLVLRIGFLLMLWLFVFAIVYALRSDLFGAPVRKMQAGGNAGRSGSAAPGVNADTAPVLSPVITPSGGALPLAGGPAPTQLVITSGGSAGTHIALDDTAITIGRSNDSSLVILDEYTSTYHAKLFRNGDQWMLTDLDSTNGTKLNGNRITGTVVVPTNAPITIGTTTFELRP